MLWIPFGFTADPDPAFYLNADPDLGPMSQTYAGPDPGKSQNNFYMKNVLNVGNR